MSSIRAQGLGRVYLDCSVEAFQPRLDQYEVPFRILGLVITAGLHGMLPAMSEPPLRVVQRGLAVKSMYTKPSAISSQHASRTLCGVAVGSVPLTAW
jgi:hypothetical protein